MRRKQIEPTPTRPVLPDAPVPDRRRFDRMFGIVTLVALVTVLGGMVVYFKLRTTPDGNGPPQSVKTASASVSTSSPEVGAVQAAYLQYWDAQNRAGLAADPSLVAPYTTAAGLSDYEQIVNEPTSTVRFQITADHNMQVVVYEGGVTASVDDLLVQHVTKVDASSLQPGGPAHDESDEESAILVKRGARWLIDSDATFGGTVQDASGQQVSYAAINREHSIDPQSLATLQAFYTSVWDRRHQALLSLDGSPLVAIEQADALTAELRVIGELKARGESLNERVEHNARFAFKDPSTVEVYDTVLDSSWHQIYANGARLDAPAGSVLRLGFEMSMTPSGWKVVESRRYGS